MSTTYLVLTKTLHFAAGTKELKIDKRQIKQHQLITVKHKPAEIIIQVQAYALAIKSERKINVLNCTFKCMWIIKRDDTSW